MPVSATARAPVGIPPLLVTVKATSLLVVPQANAPHVWLLAWMEIAAAPRPVPLSVAEPDAVEGALAVIVAGP